MNINEMITERITLPSYLDYQYYNCLEKNQILINDDIRDDLIELAVIPLMQMDEDKNIEHITVFLNTYGGDIYAGMNLVAALERAKTPITIHILGVAASMGIYIAMAKSDYIKTICSPYSVGLIHAGTYFNNGDLNAVRDAFEFNEHYEALLKEYVLTHSKITEELYNKIERKEHWMDANTMLEYGIVDEII